MTNNQFFSLFGRHALFRVRLTIHDISHVPLVTGKFAVKWKFRNAHSSHSSAVGKNTASAKGREGAGMDGAGAGVDQSQNSSDSAEHEQTLPVPRGSGKLIRTSSRPSTPHRTTATQLPTHESDPAKGRTSFRKISEHNVKWEHELEVVVDAAVHRETMDLGPCEVKLVVMQESVHGDVDRPKSPIFGVLYLNLAEYADPALGPVTRRYLLREGKTNATLKLTIAVEHCGGEKTFKPPPLQKVQVMGTVAGLLNEEHHLRPPPSAGFASTSFIVSPLSQIEKPLNPRRPSVSSRHSSRSVFYYDPQLHSTIPSNTTENIIEALFNPFPSSVQSPFTVPMPPRGPSQVDLTCSRTAEVLPPQLQLHDDVDSISIGESSSSHTTSTASTRRSSQTSSSWWKRLGGSRPPTPSAGLASPLRQKRPSLGSRSELGVH